MANHFCFKNFGILIARQLHNVPMSMLGLILGLLAGKTDSALLTAPRAPLKQQPTPEKVSPVRKRKPEKDAVPNNNNKKLRRSRRASVEKTAPAKKRKKPNGRSLGLRIGDWPLRIPALRVPKVDTDGQDENEGLQWITLLARRDTQEGAFRIVLYDLTLEGLEDSCEGLCNPYFIYSSEAAGEHEDDKVRGGHLYASPSTGDASWTEVPVFDHVGNKLTDLYGKLEELERG